MAVCMSVNGPHCCCAAGGARSTTINIAPPGRPGWEVLDVDEEMPMVGGAVQMQEMGMSSGGDAFAENWPSPRFP